MTEPVLPAGADVRVVSDRPPGHRLVPILSEHQLDHYPEFAEFFRRQFPLDTDPFGPPGLLGIGSRIYELTFVGRSGRPFPCGVSIAALAPDLEPLDESVIDPDVWAILEWMVEGVGGEWTAEGLGITGRIYRVHGSAT